ncbi:MAG: bifunctional riboflavin kinase/FAD synthetase [Chloroflexota bacterium]
MKDRTRMLVEQELAETVPRGDTALTIGVFDGVHLGHEFLVGKLKERASAEGLASVVVTFRQHPRRVLSSRSGLTYLTSLEERVRLLESLGVDHVVTLSFTPELAALSARDFVELLRKHLRMRALVIGPDFTLGHDREGNTARLEALGEELGFSVEVVAPIVQGGQVVSSTAIRSALSEGDMGKVSRLLGRRFILAGEVVKGDRRGKNLGFPTANLAPDPEQALPPDGVYVTRAFLHESWRQAVTNIGVRPTFGEGKRIVEVHILDLSQQDLYGEHLTIELVQRLRGETRFASADELVAQMRRDVEETRAVLRGEELPGDRVEALGREEHGRE